MKSLIVLSTKELARYYIKTYSIPILRILSELSGSELLPKEFVSTYLFDA